MEVGAGGDLKLKEDRPVFGVEKLAVAFVKAPAGAVSAPFAIEDVGDLIQEGGESGDRVSAPAVRVGIAIGVGGEDRSIR